MASDVISTLIFRLAAGTGLDVPLPFTSGCCCGVGVTDPRSPFTSVDMVVDGWLLSCVFFDDCTSLRCCVVVVLMLVLQYARRVSRRS
jgi:hypothetical protein